MRLFECDRREKKKQWADSVMHRHKRLISRVKKCCTVEDDQPKQKLKSNGYYRGYPKARHCRVKIRQSLKVRKSF